MERDGLLGGRYRRTAMVDDVDTSEVWQGEDTVQRRAVTIRQVPAADQRLPDDARLAITLDHPHAVAVQDVVIEDGRTYLVTPHVAGRTLAQLLAQRPPTVAEVASLFIGVADALATAHALGIVHRDVKPANIVFDGEGRALLVGFGSARGVRQTAAGVFVGTPACLAPELARGDDASPAGDVYALGATMYAALDGHAPFDDVRSNPLAVLSRVLTQAVPAPRNAGPLTGLLMAMLVPDPRARPSAAQVAAALVAGPSDLPAFGGPQPAAAEPVSPLDSLIGAMDHTNAMTQGWSGALEEWETLVVGELAPVLADGDRVDLFVPTLFGVDERQRAGLPRQVTRSLNGLCAGVTIALQDRLVCAWTTNSRTLAHISITLDYERVRSVQPSAYGTGDAQYVGIELDCGEFSWPILFAHHPGLDTLRYLLGGRPSGAVNPQWGADGVVSWIVPDGRGGATSIAGWNAQ